MNELRCENMNSGNILDTNPLTFRLMKTQSGTLELQGFFKVAHGFSVISEWRTIPTVDEFGNAIS